jgi:hypothetical protein
MKNMNDLLTWTYNSPGKSKDMIREEIIEDMIYMDVWNTSLTSEARDILMTIDNLKKSFKLIGYDYHSKDIIIYKIQHDIGYWRGTIKITDFIREEKLKQLGIK